MAAFSIPTNTSYKWDNAFFSTRAGNDSYTLGAGSQLVIDTDTRYCLNSSAAGGAMGAVTTYSNSVGADILIDGTNVRLIPYNTGSGNVPAIGTTISQGGVSCALLGVWSALNAAPTAAGSAMPASGYIKVKDKTGGNFAAGALTGIGATATGADVVGWIEVVGVESTSFALYRLGTFRMTGAWFDAGTTTGSAGQTIQLPASLANTYYPGVYIETSAGSGTYEFYPSAGSLVAATTPTDAVRGKLVWISSQGLVRIGSDGTNTVGYVPAAGCKVRVPNIITLNATSASPSTNAVPNTTLSSRHGFSTTGGGVISIDKANIAWYIGATQAYSVSMVDSGILDGAFFWNQHLAPFIMTRVGSGQSAAIAGYGFRAWYCKNGGAVTDCVFTSPGATQDNADIQYCNDITFTRTDFQKVTAKTSSGTSSINAQFSDRLTFQDCTTIGGRNLFTTCADLVANNTIYADIFSGTTGTTYSNAAFEITGNSKNPKIDGLSFGGLTNVHPYAQLFNITAASNPKIRNIGSRAAPLSMGSANACGYVMNHQKTFGLKVQRVYVSNLRTGFYVDAATSDGVVIENSGGQYGLAQGAPQAANVIRKGLAATMSSLTAIGLGDHWSDFFDSATTGKIGISMTEKSSVQPSATTYSIIAGAPEFSGAGSLLLNAVGDSIQWETPEWVLGHTGFQNAAPGMYNGAIGNYLIEFQVDANDGNGWSALATASAANLSAVSGIDASKGFKLRLRATCSTTNTETITGLYVATTSTTTAQDYQYDLDTATVTVSGLATGSMVKATRNDTSAVLFVGAESGGTVSFNTSYTGAITVEARKASASPYYKPWSAVGTVGTGISFTALQTLDE